MIRAYIASAVLSLLATDSLPSHAATPTSRSRLEQLNSAVELCLLSAPPPTRVHFQRSIALLPCRQAEQEVSLFEATANRNRQLGCSANLVGLRYDLLRISLHGGTSALAEQALGRIQDLHKVCTHLYVTR